MNEAYLREDTGIYAITPEFYETLSDVAKKAGLKKCPDIEIGTIPVQNLNTGDYILGIDRKFHRITQKTEKSVTGLIAAIYHLQESNPLYVSGHHRILCREKKISTAGDNFWKLFPQELYKKIKVHNKILHEGSRILWDYVKNEQLGSHFLKEYQVGPFIADFYSEEHKVIIELHDEGHDNDNYQNIMDNFFKTKGITVLRFSSEEIINDLTNTLKHIRSVLLINIPSGFKSKEWRRADSVENGDFIYYSKDIVPVRVRKIEFDETRETLFGISAEDTDTLLARNCLISCQRS